MNKLTGLLVPIERGPRSLSFAIASPLVPLRSLRPRYKWLGILVPRMGRLLELPEPRQGANAGNGNRGTAPDVDAV